MKNDPLQPKETEWHLFDAASEPLGRLATKIASLLMGKHRSDFAPHKDLPVYVVVINTDQLQVTGDKRNQKMYRRYTGYPGGLRERNMQRQMELDSRFIIHEAVSGMLPKNNLRDDRLRKLKLYTGAEHPHAPQLQGENSAIAK